MSVDSRLLKLLLSYRNNRLKSCNGRQALLCPKVIRVSLVQEFVERGNGKELSYESQIFSLKHFSRSTAY